MAAAAPAPAKQKRELIKTIVLGDSGVGKTNLLNCYVFKKFDSRYKSTIGADFVSKEIVLDDGTNVALQLWDTAGQERFQSLGTAYFRGADACVLVFDVTNQESFEHLSSWLEEFLSQSGQRPVVLLGNKCDKDLDPARRAVTATHAKRWCQQQGGAVEFYETSAKDALNVDDAFQAIAAKALKERRAKRDEDDVKLPNPNRIKIGPKPEVKPDGGCPC